MDSDGDTTNTNSDLTDNAVNEGNSNHISNEGSVTSTEDTDNGDSNANSPVVDDNTKSDTSINTGVAANNTNNSTQPSKDKSSI